MNVNRCCRTERRGAAGTYCDEGVAATAGLSPYFEDDDELAALVHGAADEERAEKRRNGVIAPR